MNVDASRVTGTPSPDSLYQGIYEKATELGRQGTNIPLSPQSEINLTRIFSSEPYHVVKKVTFCEDSPMGTPQESIEVRVSCSGDTKFHATLQTVDHSEQLTVHCCESGEWLRPFMTLKDRYV